MTEIKSYELYVLRHGSDWTVDSIFDSKEIAMDEARSLSQNKRFRGVKVIEESLDESSGRSIATTLFQKTPDAQADNNKAKTPVAATDDEVENHGDGQLKGTKTDKSQEKVVNSLVLLTLGVGGGALIIILGLFFLAEIVS